MSAMDDVLTKIYPIDLDLAELGNADLWHIRQELAALRDDSLLLIGSNRLLSEIGEALGCAPDATILDSIAALREAIEQARDEILQGREEIGQARILISKINQSLYLKRDLQVEVNHWLAAHPAPQPHAEEQAE